MNAEKIREIRKQITPELSDLLWRIQHTHQTCYLLELLIATDIEAQKIVDLDVERRRFVRLPIPGWLEAGANCKADADVVPYLLAEILDRGES